MEDRQPPASPTLGWVPQGPLTSSPFSGPSGCLSELSWPWGTGQASSWPLLPGNCSIQHHPSLGLKGVQGHLGLKGSQTEVRGWIPEQRQELGGVSDMLARGSLAPICSPMSPL